MKRLFLALIISLYCASSVGAQTFTQSVSDNFNRATENPLNNSVWTTVTGQTAMKIDSAVVANVATRSNGAVDCASYYSGTTFSADQYARANLTITTGTTGGGRGMMLLVRVAAGANTFYRFTVDHAASNNAEIARVTAGAYVKLGASWTQSFTDADQFTFAVRGTGTNTVLYVYDKNGALVTTRADNGGSALNSGYPGIGYSSNEGVATDTYLDNFSAGAFGLNRPIMPLLFSWARSLFTIGEVYACYGC